MRWALYRTHMIVVAAAVILLAQDIHGGLTRHPSQRELIDDDFRGWQAMGEAFVGQPVRAAAVTTNLFAPVRVGGDYWKDLPYPLGQEGDGLVTSGLAGDVTTGTFTSPPFVLRRETPYFSFLIGGTNDIGGVRLELQVSETTDKFREGESTVVFRASGEGHEQLEYRTWRVPEPLVNRLARVVIIDASRTGHINLDAVRLLREPQQPRPAPVWGYADYHTHPMTYRAFGALKGVRTIWGQPGGRFSDYEKAPALVAIDLPACEPAHGGGPFARPFLNGAQKLQYKQTLDLLFTHPNQGWPSFKNFPGFLQSTHQQMHITQIRRNYEGGLRLMVALATDNVGAEYLMSSVGKDGHVPLIKEQASLEAQLEGMKELAEVNASWMQIAYTPDAARNIILHNKLAIVLGIEMDQLGTYGCASAAEEVDYLWNHGIRVVTPIHAIDNRIGGAAVFIAPYNWLNDLIHRPIQDVSLAKLHTMTPQFFEIEEQKCSLSSGNDGECIQNRLEAGKQQRLYIGQCLVSVTQAWFLTSPCLDPTPSWKAYDTAHGHANKNGLFEYGEKYLQALMAKGMIVDTAHMSAKSVDGTFTEIGKKLRRDHPECSEFPAIRGCDALAYPAIISHAHFREQAFYGPNEEFLPSEYDISNHHLDLVRRVGGVVGPFVEDRVSTEWPVPNYLAPANDCAMSSKSFVYSYRYAAMRLGRFGVGMATDLTLIPGVSPRFGDDACWAYNLARDTGHERKQHPDRYNIRGQQSPVIYGLSGLTQYVLRNRQYDFNKDGLAHYGLVPDMLQDLKNVGMPGEDRELLFRSADDYIRMWERTFRVAYGQHR